jgi:hypothetical protein
MATKQNDWRLWALDDASLMDPPTIETGGDEGAETLWADDAQVWDQEPQTSPDVGDPVDQPESGSKSMP